MMKEELYKLSLDSYTEYPLLAELMAIRDERFKDEQQDSMLCVNGYVGLDTLNNYVKLQQENTQLKEKIKWFENPINYFNYANKTLKDKNTQLRIEISAREEEYRRLKNQLVEVENWLRPVILQLMETAKQDYFWITDQQIDNAKLVPIEFTVMGDRSVKFKKVRTRCK